VGERRDKRGGSAKGGAKWKFIVQEFVRAGEFEYYLIEQEGGKAIGNRRGEEE